MSDRIVMYDETEQTTTRYIGFIATNARYDLMIVTTEHFFGKSVVTCIQTGRTAIMNNEEANSEYVAHAFGIANQDEADELAEFLLVNL